MRKANDLKLVVLGLVQKEEGIICTYHHTSFCLLSPKHLFSPFEDAAAHEDAAGPSEG
jgi:hypothetical protein